MQAFIGTLVDTPVLGELRIRQDHLLVVNEKGVIHQIVSSSSSAEAERLLKTIDEERIHRLEPCSFILPTFSDLHLHAPQYLYAGTGLDLPLMEWLDKYAYRAEERIDADLDLARRVYRRLCQRLVEVGTGCVVLFGTIGIEANLVLADELRQAGLRGFVGKLSMDKSPRPTYGEASTAESLASVTSFLDHFESSADPTTDLVKPILTPRFVPVCSDELLSGLAQIAEDRGVRVQSHMCESRDQMIWVESTRGKKDEVVFDKAGLLRPGTVQAHVTSLPSKLIHLCKERGVVAAHCPLSNAYFSDAQFPLREVLDAEMAVGLGSDIAGGYSISVQNSMRSAVYTSRLREGARRENLQERGSTDRIAGEKSLRVDWKESLWVATSGGKSSLGLGGLFEVGMEFDAQQITLSNQEHPTGVGALDLFDRPPSDDRLESWWTEATERWWCNGDDRNRTGMWIQGRRLR